MNIFLNTKSPKGIALIGSGIVIALLFVASLILFISLPDANAFNDRVEQIFVQNDALTTTESVKLLEVLAQSGTAFADVLQGYRFIIFVLLVLASALLLAALYFLLNNYGLARRVSEIERSGIMINSLIINREEQVVYINNMEFELTEAACETLSVLCEARLDDEVMTGADMEAMITGKNSIDCDEASGATRIKRLRDHLGNQIVSQLLIKNISRKGYILSIDKDVIRML
ncbi:winged helix-turn-helix domain-containing protein [Paramylibacter kogurei]|uniref:winged helix-turn-helix domain-containing protein n=1 Tax=Paramylibacter kogurei TaxID=1889778 RepID=UPI0026867C7F